MNAGEQAERFLRDTEFHLGFLPTEQSHPRTRDFSRLVQEDTASGLRQLFSVDRDIPPVAERSFSSREFERLVEGMRGATAGGGRICFSGCGSTGRLAIILETLWRTFWMSAADRFADRGRVQAWRARAGQAYSMMTGGDLALVRAVESFEDYEVFGRRQVLDAGIGRGDLLVAMTEGGETSSVIGTARQAADEGALTFFVFGNPADLLSRRIRRSAEVIADRRVVAMDLTTGPMAVAGSTRMQATSCQMLVIGAAMEQACRRLLEAELRPRELEQLGFSSRGAADARYASRFSALLDRLQDAGPLREMGGLAELEEQVYRAGGLVTYFARDFLLDVFSDTTERTPTFMLPPFRPGDDLTSPPSWAFARNPLLDTEDAWREMLKREPRGLAWDADAYRRMGAEERLAADPPALGIDRIHRFVIGREEDTGGPGGAPRWKAPDSALVLLRVDAGGRGPWDEELGRAFLREAGRYGRALEVLIGGSGESRAGSADRLGRAETEGRASETPTVASVRVAVEPPVTPMRLLHHLAVKLVFNAVSTATMGRLGRIRNNWMIQVAVSNKKLIDRSCRIISEIAGLPYEQACRELFRTLASDRAAQEAAADPTAGTRTRDSVVVRTLERISP